MPGPAPTVKALRATSKVCTYCGKEKPRSEFYVARRSPDGLQGPCKKCHLEMNKRKVQEKRRAVYLYLLEHPCVDCGESDPVVLEFDHVGEKKAEIGKMISYSCRLDLIFEEISKCEVRCANCHKRKTAKDRGWYKDLDLPNTAKTR